MKKFLKLSLIICLLIVVNSCSKDLEESNDSNSSLGIIDELDEDTVIITSESNNLLTDINDDRLIFSSTNNQLNSLVVGSIMASNMHFNAPNGYLREVVSMSTSGGNVIVNTIQASVADAIKNVDFNYSYSIGDENIIDIDDSGVDITNDKSVYSSNKEKLEQNIQITVPFKGFELYTEGKDKIILDGSVKLTFDIDFHLKIENNSLKDFKFIQNVNALADATLKASVENLPKIQKQKVLKVITLAPLSVPIFGLPVPFAKQWIVIVLGVNGEISAGFEVGTKNVYSMKAGVDYNNLSGWNNLFETTNDFTPSYGDVFVKGELEGWIQARYEVRPYAIPSSRIFFANKTGPKLSGGISTSDSGLLNLDLSWCVESNVKAQVQIFDKTIIDFNKSIYNQCFNIESWTNTAIDENLLPGTWRKTGETENGVDVYNNGNGCDHFTRFNETQIIDIQFLGNTPGECYNTEITKGVYTLEGNKIIENLSNELEIIELSDTNLTLKAVEGSVTYIMPFERSIDIIGTWKKFSETKNGEVVYDSNDCDLFISFSQTKMIQTQYSDSNQGECDIKNVSSGTYTLEGNVITEYATDGQIYYLEIIELTDTRIVLNQVDGGNIYRIVFIR